MNYETLKIFVGVFFVSMYFVLGVLGVALAIYKIQYKTRLERMYLDVEANLLNGLDRKKNRPALPLVIQICTLDLPALGPPEDSTLDVPPLGPREA